MTFGLHDIFTNPLGIGCLTNRGALYNKYFPARPQVALSQLSMANWVPRRGHPLVFHGVVHDRLESRDVLGQVEVDLQRDGGVGGGALRAAPQAVPRRHPDRRSQPLQTAAAGG